MSAVSHGPRSADAGDELLDRAAAADHRAPWHGQVIVWMFPSSRRTHVVLVAALQNPTRAIPLKEAQEHESP